MANKDLYSIFAPNDEGNKERIKKRARKKFVGGDSKGVKVGEKAGIDDSSQDWDKRPGFYDTSELRAVDDPMVDQLTASFRKMAGLNNNEPIDFGTGHSHTGGSFAKRREDYLGQDQEIPDDLEEIENQADILRAIARPKRQVKRKTGRATR